MAIRRIFSLTLKKRRYFFLIGTPFSPSLLVARPLRIEFFCGFPYECLRPKISILIRCETNPEVEEMMNAWDQEESVNEDVVAEVNDVQVRNNDIQCIYVCKERVRRLLLLFTNFYGPFFFFHLHFIQTN